jgi:PKD repeat protein
MNEKACSQNNNNWALGYKKGINFNTLSPSILNTDIKSDTSNLSITGSFTSASYSNCDGKLIIYGNGTKIWNSKHELMKNGLLNNGDQKLQSYIIKVPGNTNLYYYFYFKNQTDCSKQYLMYALIDIDSNNGLGEIIKKDISVDTSKNPTLTGSNNLTFAKHSNNKYIWLIVANNSTTTKSYLITDTSIIGNPIISNGIFSGNLCESYTNLSKPNSTYRNYSYNFGQFKATQDSKFIIATGIDSSTTKNGCCYKYNFNQKTGILSNPDPLLEFKDVPSSKFKNDPKYLSNFFNLEIAPNDSSVYFISQSVNSYDINNPGYASVYTSTIVKVNIFNKIIETTKKFQNRLIGLQMGPNACMYTLNITNGINYIIPRMLSIKDISNNLISEEIFRDSFLMTYNLPSVFQPYYKLYYNTNLYSNPCVDTAIFNIHADNLFRDMTIYFGDGDSLYIKAPLNASYQIKHYYHLPGKYLFKIKALNPNCNYFTQVVDSFNLFKAPSRLQSLITNKAYCENSVLIINDSFVNTNSAIYSWPNNFVDSFFLIDSIKNKAINFTKTLLLPKVSWTLKIANTNCPFPLEYNDSVILNYLPKAKIKYELYNGNYLLSVSTNSKNKYKVCAPFTLNFIDSTSLLKSGSLSYLGKYINYSKNRNISLDLEPGVFHLIVNDTNNYGCMASDTIHINAVPKPKTSWTKNDSIFCSNLPKVSISIRSLFSGSQALLYWGDNDSSFIDTIDVVSHLYSKPGKYLLNLQTKNSFCSENLIDSIFIAPLPNSTFIIDQDSICFKGNNVLLRRNMSDSSLWNYGDGIIDTASQHHYKTFGQFKITHYSKNKFNCSDSSHQIMTVLESPILNCFVLDSILCADNHIVDLNASTTFSKQNALKLKIDWGDLMIDTSSSQTNFKHHYNIPGTHNIKSTLVANNLCQDSQTNKIQILSNPSFNMLRLGECSNDSISISTTNLKLNGLNRINWWDNHTPLNETSSSIKTFYTKAGTHLVSVLVIDSNNCQETDSILFLVLQKPVANFSFNRLDVSISLKFQFNNLSKHYNKVYWTFNQVDTSSSYNPYYTFKDSGNFKVVLIASNNDQCFDTLTQNIPVYQNLNFFFPNAFSPNNNGINDEFGLSYSQSSFVKKFRLRIYNRWGEMLYDSQDKFEYWKPSKQTQGIFIYKVDILDIYNIQQSIKGTIEILE